MKADNAKLYKKVRYLQSYDIMIASIPFLFLLILNPQFESTLSSEMSLMKTIVFIVAIYLTPFHAVTCITSFFASMR